MKFWENCKQIWKNVKEIKKKILNDSLKTMETLLDIEVIWHRCPYYEEILVSLSNNFSEIGKNYEEILEKLWKYTYVEHFAQT